MATILSELPPLSDGDLGERFWSRVDKSTDCWLWTGALGSHGYGAISFAGRMWLVHRLSYAAHVADPGDLCVLHRCDVRRCVNPGHLFLGDRAENHADMLQKGRARGGALKGEANPRATLTADMVAEIRRQFVPGRRGDGKKAAAAFGISVAQVSKILRREAWPHV